MRSYKPQLIEKEPVVTVQYPDGVLQYPDYLIYRLYTTGPGRIEADRRYRKQGRVEFILTSLDDSVIENVGSLPSGLFRSFLARMSTIMELPGNYTGHALFVCNLKLDDHVRDYRFSAFFCNEPSMAIWFKLYLYCIDGIWPMK